MNVQQIMNREVESVDSSTTISRAAEKMRQLDIGFLPVLDHDRLVGTLTDRDIAIRSVAQGRDPRLATVGEIMSQQVFHCYEDDTLEAVGKYMQETGVRRMVILSRDQKLAGIVSLGDIARTTGETNLAGETLGQITEAA